MTPNLQLVFQTAKHQVPLDLAATEYDTWSHRNAHAKRIVLQLLWNHGEALIEALELAIRSERVGDVDALPVLENLLATLEREAQL